VCIFVLSSAFNGIHSMENIMKAEIDSLFALKV
jgi:hypothetical protein